MEALHGWRIESTVRLVSGSIGDAGVRSGYIENTDVQKRLHRKLLNAKGGYVDGTVDTCSLQSCVLET